MSGPGSDLRNSRGGGVSIITEQPPSVVRNVINISCRPLLERLTSEHIDGSLVRVKTHLVVKDEVGAAHGAGVVSDHLTWSRTV